MLVGGCATAVQGARRPTRDVDITPDTDLGSLGRLVDALQELGVGIRVDAEPAAFALQGALVTVVQSVTLKLKLQTPHGDLDQAIRPGSIDGCAELVQHATSLRSARCAARWPASRTSPGP